MTLKWHFYAREVAELNMARISFCVSVRHGVFHLPVPIQAKVR